MVRGQLLVASCQFKTRPDGSFISHFISATYMVLLIAPPIGNWSSRSLASLGISAAGSPPAKRLNFDSCGQSRPALAQHDSETGYIPNENCAPKNAYDP